MRLLPDFAMTAGSNLLAGPNRLLSPVAAHCLALAVAAVLALAAPGPRAEDAADAPEETPAAGAPANSGSAASAIKTSGLPVPRYVTIRSAEVNARTGPSTKYPIEWVFARRGMPVEVVAEFDTWRRIRDREGSEGWVLHGMLSPKRSIMITGEVRTLRREPAPAARAVARAEPGVVAQLLRCKEEWCEIDAGGYRGWLRRGEVWGIYPAERLE